MRGSKYFNKNPIYEKPFGKKQNEENSEKFPAFSSSPGNGNAKNMKHQKKRGKKSTTIVPSVIWSVVKWEAWNITFPISTADATHLFIHPSIHPQSKLPCIERMHVFYLLDETAELW